MMTDLKNGVFTIINQIPTSETVGTKCAWIKHTLHGCGKSDGIFDRSTGNMIFKAGTWTAYISDLKGYTAPSWVKGYYSLSQSEKAVYYTVNVGDLLIFTDIPEEAPETLSEFKALCEKYKDMGGIINSAQAYIRYKSDGTPWKTNHIEAVKA